MRNAACTAWCELYAERPFVFLTGDLGFMALEPLRDQLGGHFINAGVAEQNMVSVAAGIRQTGIETWVYSIAPFAYARPFEQIRNDVCINRQPVYIVGNGGGYGYGVQGPTHHAIEDYGVLLALQGMNVYVPAFADDVGLAIRQLSAAQRPAYLRLGRCEKPKEFAAPKFTPWRKLLEGGGPILVAVGPIVGPLISAVAQMDVLTRPELWLLSVMPAGIDALPAEIVDAARAGRSLAVVEEHVSQGSAGTALVARLAAMGVPPRMFMPFNAKGYPSATYGSQAFHRVESGIDAESVLRALSTTDSRQ